MSIVKNNKLNRNRVKMMVKRLLPNASYVRVSKVGVVTMKKHWYSFRKNKALLTDMVIDTLPTALSKEVGHVNESSNLANLFADELYLLMKLRSYRDDVDIVKTLWNCFNRYLRTTPKFEMFQSSTIRLENKKVWLPDISVCSWRNIPNLSEIISHTKGKSQRDTLISKLGNIIKREQLRNRYILPQLNIAQVRLAS